VLNANPAAVTGGYEITLRAGQGAAFANLAAGAPLFLRGRPLMAFIRAHGGVVPVDYSIAVSPALTFTRVVGDVVTVGLATALPPDWNLPAPGSRLLNPILIAPRLHPTSQAPLPLLSAPVATHINSLVPPTPLNRDPGVACDSTAFDVITFFIDRALQSPTHLPNHPKLRSIQNQAKILGLYDAGASYDCLAYHPSGLCTMRKVTGTEIGERDPAAPRHLRGGGLVPYCHVCQYLIVDVCNPALHGRLDDSYDHFYLDPP